MGYIDEIYWQHLCTPQEKELKKNQVSTQLHNNKINVKRINSRVNKGNIKINNWDGMIE